MASSASTSHFALRSGAWTPEEHEYANALIEEFKAGSMQDLAEGTSMRGFLAKMLGCYPKRVSKKYESTKYNGKRQYAKNKSLSQDEIIPRLFKLERLKQAFLRSIRDADWSKQDGHAPMSRPSGMGMGSMGSLPGDLSSSAFPYLGSSGNTVSRSSRSAEWGDSLATDPATAAAATLQQQQLFQQHLQQQRRGLEQAASLGNGYGSHPFFSSPSLLDSRLLGSLSSNSAGMTTRESLASPSPTGLLDRTFHDGFASLESGSSAPGLSGANNPHQGSLVSGMPFAGLLNRPSSDSISPSTTFLNRAMRDNFPGANYPSGLQAAAGGGGGFLSSSNHSVGNILQRQAMSRLQQLQPGDEAKLIRLQQLEQEERHLQQLLRHHSSSSSLPVQQGLYPGNNVLSNDPLSSSSRLDLDLQTQRQRLSSLNTTPAEQDMMDEHRQMRQALIQQHTSLAEQYRRSSGFPLTGHNMRNLMEPPGSSMHHGGGIGGEEKANDNRYLQLQLLQQQTEAAAAKQGAVRNLADVPRKEEAPREGNAAEDLLSIRGRSPDADQESAAKRQRKS